MNTMTIHLHLTKDVKSFVNIVSKYPYEIDLRQGRYVVDAKSILGIFSLDLSQPVLVETPSADYSVLFEDLKAFIG